MQIFPDAVWETAQGETIAMTVIPLETETRITLFHYVEELQTKLKLITADSDF